MKLLRKVALKEYSTFDIGGIANYFVIADSIADLLQALEFARKKSLRFFVLGGGSNVIFPDRGFEGVVIKINFQKVSFVGEKIIAQAGVTLDRLVDLSLERGLGGLEWAAGIPGTIGGAVYGNAGANGGEMAAIVDRLKVLKSGRICWMTQKQCRFAYRDSIFKHKDWLILEAKMTLKKTDKSKIIKIANYNRQERKKKHPLEYPSVGSIFKNVPLAKIPPAVLCRFQNVIKPDPFPVVPAAAIIASAGLKGKKIGDAQVSLKHPNFIVNLNKAKSSDVLMLIEEIREVVKEKFGVELTVEPIIVS